VANGPNIFQMLLVGLSFRSKRLRSSILQVANRRKARTPAVRFVVGLSSCLIHSNLSLSLDGLT